MRLFRGYKTPPTLMTPELRQELDGLHKLQQAKAPDESNIISVLEKMGHEHFTRWMELRQAAGAQFFTDQELVAREVAGDKGFIMALDVEDKIAHAHYNGEQIMQRGSDQRVVSNFVFSGSELGEHLNDWKFNVIDIEKENTGKEGKISGE